MNCEDIKKYLGDFIAGELAAKQKADIEDHLTHCEKCRKEQEFEEGWVKLLHFDEIPDPGENFWNSLEGNILSRVEDTRADESAEFEDTESHNLVAISKYLIPLAASIILFIGAIGTDDILIFQPEIASVSHDQVVGNLTILDEKPYLNISKGNNKTGILCTIMTSPPGSTERHILAGKISQEKKR